MAPPALEPGALLNKNIPHPVKVNNVYVDIFHVFI
jgi:hypothetical protein